MPTRHQLFRDFAADQRGSTAIIFAAACIGLVGVIGLSIDSGRAMGARTKAASALDAAALAATRTLFTGADDAEVEAAAERVFKANVTSDGDLGASYGGPDYDLTLDINHVTKTIEVSVNVISPTTFGRVFEVDAFNFVVSSVATFNVRDIELGMALDVTGSMNWNGKMDDLKVAAKDLIDTLLPDTGSFSDVKIGIAPYSAAVNPGADLAALVTDPAEPSPDNCVFERDGGDAVLEAKPVDGSWLGTAFGGAPDDIDPYEGAGNYFCPTAEVMPLADDKVALKGRIDELQPGGWTSGHLGAAWGWYLVSPEWSTIWQAGSQPRAYETPNLIKAVILMTDGIFNTAYKNGPSADQALEICENMKAQGVIVYSIAFQAPETAEETLTDCASIDPVTGEKLVYTPENGAEIRQAFQDIAIKLTNLRLAN